MSGRRPQRTGVYNFINDFREAPGAADWLTMPGYFKSYNYTVLGHSKLFHPGHPANYDEPLSWTQEQPYFYPPTKSAKNPDGVFQDCGYFDVCPTNQSLETIMDQATVTQAIKTIKMAAAMDRPFFVGVGIIRPHLPFVMPQDLWDMYNESSIKVTNNTVPPDNCPQVALNDQIFQGANWPHYHPPAGKPRTFTDMSPYKAYPPEAQRFLRHGYYAAITWVDLQFGRMLDALERLKVAADTGRCPI